jgi:hypothetical protein
VSRLADNECCRVIRQFDIGPVVEALDRMSWFAANITGSVNNPNSYPCDVVLADKFPPVLRELVASIDLTLGGDVARAILRRLPPRQSIPPHVDAWMPAEADWRRFQLPLVTHPDVVMRWPKDGVEVHLEPGTLYEVRYDRTHEVVHGADVARVHLQIDQMDATL